MMTYFRKRIKLEMVIALNEKIIRDKKDDDENIHGSGIGTSENIEVKNN